MFDLHKSKSYDVKDMFNNTSRYLDDIFVIDAPDLINVFLIYINGTSVE